MDTVYQKEEILTNFIERGHRWSGKTILTALGALNKFITIAAYKAGYLKRVEDKDTRSRPGIGGWNAESERNYSHTFDDRNLNKFLRCDEIQIPFDWIAKELIGDWVEDTSNGDAKAYERLLKKVAKRVERLFHRMSEMGLWGDLDSVPQSRYVADAGCNMARRSPTKHTGFCMEIAMLSYEKLEVEAIHRWGFEGLPEHKGAMVPLIYEKVFKRRFNRPEQNENVKAKRDTQADQNAVRWAIATVQSKIQGLIPEKISEKFRKWSWCSLPGDTKSTVNDAADSKVEAVTEAYVQAAILEKPGKGDRCNGCGLCCLAEQCPVSVELFDEQSRCPALEHSGNEYRCGLMMHPSKYGAVPDWVEELGRGDDIAVGYYRSLIGAGIGCDSEDEPFD